LRDNAANSAGVAISSSFCARVSCLTRYSSWSALRLVPQRRTTTISIGVRVRV
jgi:hypothetical protein